MELTERHENMPSRSWTRRTDGKHLSDADYSSELRSWLQHAILEAEKNKNYDKKDELIILLKEL